MARIVTGNVDAYVKKLLSDEFGSDVNEDIISQDNIHSDALSVPVENTNLVCSFCELFIVNPDEIKDLSQQPKLTGNLAYSICPLCGQDAIDKKNSAGWNKTDN